MKTITFIAVLLFLQINLAVANSADEIVYETTQEVLNELETNKERLQAEPEYIQTIVRDLIIPHMDFDTMSAITLGSSWKKLSEDEQTCFSVSFKNQLVERYAYILLVCYFQ